VLNRCLTLKPSFTSDKFYIRSSYTD